MEDKFQMDVMLLRMVTKAMSQAHGEERQLEFFPKMIKAMSGFLRNRQYDIPSVSVIDETIAVDGTPITGGCNC